MIIYGGWQRTDRDHYTGIFPDDDSAILIHNANPPYGSSVTSTFQGGFQLNHKLENTWGLENVLTFGTEYNYDDVFDEIDAYNYLITWILVEKKGVKLDMLEFLSIYPGPNSSARPVLLLICHSFSRGLWRQYGERHAPVPTNQGMGRLMPKQS